MSPERAQYTPESRNDIAGNPHHGATPIAGRLYPSTTCFIDNPTTCQLDRSEQPHRSRSEETRSLLAPQNTFALLPLDTDHIRL